MGWKVTLAQAAAEGGIRLEIYCMNHAVHYGGCFHSAHMEIWIALRLWPDSARLDDLPFRCSRCGERNTDVRTYIPVALPSAAHARRIADAIDSYRLRKSWRFGAD